MSLRAGLVHIFKIALTQENPGHFKFEGLSLSRIKKLQGSRTNLEQPGNVAYIPFLVIVTRRTAAQ